MGEDLPGRFEQPLSGFTRDWVENGDACFDIDEKRVYMPGIKIHSQCPDCGQEHVKDLGRDYLAFPTFNRIEPVHFYCGDCDGPNGDCEWDVDCVLEFNLRLAENSDYGDS